MTNSRRVKTASGAVLLEGNRLDRGLAEAHDLLFEPRFWSARGRILPAGRGRGAAWFLDVGVDQWVLRHFRRGGFMSHLSEDRYLWTGETRVRAFAEFRLLEHLHAQSLPVPVPVAARYQRRGLYYRCDLITQRIRGATPLSEVLAAGEVDDTRWREVGAAVGRLHAAGVDHADLNAHNILLDERGTVSIIDLDRGRVRAARIRAGRIWTEGNLRRLRRSISRICADLPACRFGDEQWRSLLAGYAPYRAQA